MKDSNNILIILINLLIITCYLIVKTKSELLKNQSSYNSSMPNSIKNNNYAIKKLTYTPRLTSKSIFLLEIYNFVESHSNFDALKSKFFDNMECLEIIYKAYSEKIDFAKDYNFISLSGKRFDDRGDKSECEDKGFDYTLLEYRLNNFQYKNSYVNSLHKFLNPFKTYVGLCLPLSCRNVVNFFFDEHLNKPFYDFVYKFNISDLQIVHSPEFNRKYEVTDPDALIFSRTKDKVITILLWIMLGYIILRVLFTATSHIYSSYKQAQIQKQKQKQIIDDSSLNFSTSNFSLGNSNSSIDESYCNKYFEKFEKNIKDIKIGDHDLSLKKQSTFKKNNFLFTFNKYFSLISHFQYLFSAKNMYYDNTNFGLFCIARIVTVFFITYKQVFNISLKIPHNEGGNHFFKKLGFSTVKQSTFWLDVYIILEGIYLSFKLLSNVNYLKSELKFKTVLKFITYALSRFILGLLIFIFLYVCLVELGLQINEVRDKETLSAFHRIYYSSKHCFYCPYEVAIPFYSQYQSKSFLKNNTQQTENVLYNNNSYQNFSCWNFIHMSFNLFYSIVITCFLTYMSFKLKSKLFDYTASIVFIVNYFLIFIWCSRVDKKFPDFMVIDFVLLENISFIKTHIFISTFYFGFILGTIYFYHIDIISNPKHYAEEVTLNYIHKNGSFKDRNNNKDNNKDNLDMSNNSNINDSLIIERISVETINKEENKFYQEYVFMKFCFQIMMKLNNISNGCWNALAIASLIIIIFLSIDFSLLSLVTNGVKFSINNLNYILYCYEKKIFNIAFSVLVMYQIFNKKSIYNTYFLGHIYYSYTLDRISFCYYCCLEPSLVLLLSYFNVEYRVSIINLILISTSLLVIILFSSYMLVVLFEIPLRIYIKRLFIDQTNKKNISTYEDSRSNSLNPSIE